MLGLIRIAGVLGFLVSAAHADPAVIFRGFGCQVPTPVGTFYSTDTRITASGDGERAVLQCRFRVPDYHSGAQSDRNFYCVVNTAYGGFGETFRNRYTISATGNALLQCMYDLRKDG